MEPTRQRRYCARAPIGHETLGWAGGDLRFALLEPPVDLGRFPMQMAWHPRHRRDPGHAWLRRLARALCGKLTEQES